MAPASPTVAVWELGLRLRERREQSGLTAATVGKRVGTGQSFISGVESGKLKVSEAKLTELIGVYEFDEAEADELHALRRAAGERGWWNGYSALFSDELLRFFGFEHGAECIRTYDTGLISGLLQTEAYAHAVMYGGSPNIRLAEVDRRVEVRLRRQRRLDGDDPVQLHVLINEAALHQRVGGRTVLVDQLHHLADQIDGHPDNLDVRVVPFTADAYDALGGSTFYLLGFANARLPTLLWQETITSSELSDHPMRVREYALAYNQAANMALSREDSLALIVKTAKEMT